ncbi:transposase [Bradyrhizobium sp. 143]|uniref:transposase n=1 Tax=Bradyrhizobium sp. 143 TaxID=2782619 RepID=UPI001FFBAF2B|nr:transposase [Bradyrhizobium sp. 143]
MPGVGPIASLAVETFAPPMETFKCGRDFAVWLGLVPLQKSTGGKQRLGRRQRWGNATFDDCSSSVPWLSSNGPLKRASARDPGLHA